MSIENWYRCRIAFSTLLYLCNGNSVDNLAKTIESFVRSDEFCGFGHPPDDKISEIIDEGIEIGVFSDLFLDYTHIRNRTRNPSRVISNYEKMSSPFF